MLPLAWNTVGLVKSKSLPCEELKWRFFTSICILDPETSPGSYASPREPVPLPLEPKTNCPCRLVLLQPPRKSPQSLLPLRYELPIMRVPLVPTWPR